ncbi:MAG TPA: M48 family metallopeptidase [Acidimicrobiales bacterium]|nr:M48 family metallopeptidase [Acidimicrobiales bacterium]
MLIAAMIHGTAVLVAVAGLWLLITSAPDVWGITGALFLLVVALFLAPRPGRLSAVHDARFPSDLRALFELCQMVAVQLRSRPPAAIVIDGSFNASWRHVGWRRQPVLTLGVPLWAILDPGERVALLAHEFAHEKNGDATNGLFVATAVATLDRWRAGLTPATGMVASTGFLAISEYGSRALQHLLRAVATGIRRLLVASARRANPLSEYLADRLAAGVAGTDALLSLLEVMATAPACMAAVRGSALAQRADVWALERAALASLRPEDRHTLAALARQRGDRVDDSHPATWRRIELLQRMTPAGGGARLPVRDDLFAAIDLELAADFGRVARIIRNMELERRGG